ncbi:DUF1257 domain-containing protein [Streptomyces sulfonofaciens]
MTTRITDPGALCAALAGVGHDTVQVHDDPQPLFGCRAGRRTDRAHAIGRRHIGRASNDIGYRHRSEGHYAAVISEYDRGKHDDGWPVGLTARRAYHLTAATLAAQGFHLTDGTTADDGTVRRVPADGQAALRARAGARRAGARTRPGPSRGSPVRAGGLRGDADRSRPALVRSSPGRSACTSSSRPRAGCRPPRGPWRTSDRR